MKQWLIDAGYVVQFLALVFVVLVLAWVLGFLASHFGSWAPPAWLAWVYPPGVL